MRIMVWLYRYIFGRVGLRFYGEFPERILNLCAANSITLWGSKFKNNGIVANMALSDFYKLREIMRGTGIRLHITEKRGFPFLATRYKKRWGIIIGAVIFLVVLEILSGFIWIIDVDGNNLTSRSEIISACEKIGIKSGMKKSDVAPKNHREKLLLELDSLTWAALNIEGSRLTINVSEAKKDKVSANRPCNLKAEFDGIIKKLDITAGDCVVKVGDAVKKGDVLVSGIIENAGGTRFVASKGEVIALVEKNYTLSESFEKKVLSETGKTKTKKVIELFNLKIPLFLGKETKSFNEKYKITDTKLFGKQLPIRIYSKKFCYTEERVLKRDEKNLKDILEKQMLEIINEEKTEDYTIKTKEFSRSDEAVTLTFTLSVQRNIAYCDYLLINAGN